VVSVLKGILLFLVSVVAGSATRADPPLLITGAKVLDEKGETLIDGASLLVRRGRIERVTRNSAHDDPIGADLQRLNLDGLTLLPGLIDLHSHLLLHPYNEAPWDDQVLRESLELRTVRAVAAARATLEAGFTTLRDLGTEGAGFADVALRDAIEKGIVPGPRVVAVTRAIVATACYAPVGFDRRWDVPQGAQEATGVDEVRLAVRQQIAAGADWIKVYADFPRGSDKTASPTFSQEELNALVDEARAAGRKVAAHATSDEGIRRAVLAGAATIEHGYGASEGTLALMREKGVALCPTLSAPEAVARYAAEKRSSSPASTMPAGEAPASDPVAESRAMFARALASGVTIACGSDVGVFSHGENARELELMVSYGMTPAQALRAATITAAKVLGREKDLGRIARGCVADLVAVRGNPLEDVSILRRPVLVIKDGRAVVGRRE
jgi:imidazolonepropionase-like amidohydrolase